MTLPELSVKRHVLAWMMSAVLVLVGIIGYQRVGLDRYPFIEFPVISITTTLKGANPDIVDSSITNVIESAVEQRAGHRARAVHLVAGGVDGRTSPSPSRRRLTWPSTRSSPRSNQVLRRLPQGC